MKKNPALARPWGTGSIETRGGRYLARYRASDGSQVSRMFASLQDAHAHLDEDYAVGRGNRPVPVAGLRALIAIWRESAQAHILNPVARGRGPGWAEGRKECAGELERMINERGHRPA